MTVGSKVFAPALDRTEQGWVLFPRDVEWRKRCFDPESMKHPAKMNLYLEQAIIEFVSEPGEKLLDPMSGTGSLMIATEMESGPRAVFCIEDAPIFHHLQQRNKALFVGRGVDETLITLLYGPCQDFLPLTGFFDHVIFSPPYSDMLKSQGNTEFVKSMFPNWEHDSLQDYLGGSQKNLGRMSSFFYNQEMMKVYKLLYESLRPGGTMTSVVRDQMKQGKPAGLCDWVMRTCIRSGFELFAWEKRECGNTGFKQRIRAQGHDTIDYEDICIFKRPEVS